MFCEEPTPEPEKIICRCKNCVLRHSDVLPWPEPLGIMAERDGDKDGLTSRRVSTRTIQSDESVYTMRGIDDKQNTRYKDRANILRYESEPATPTHQAGTPIINQATTPIHHVTNSPGTYGGNTPMRAPTQDPTQAPTQAPAQPTILLIVVNKNDPPPFPGRGYPEAGAGQRHHGQGHLGPGPRGFPGGPPGYYPPPPSGIASRRRSRPNYGHENVCYDSRRHSEGYRNNRFGYQEDWRGQSRSLRPYNNVYANQPYINRHSEDRRSCRCPNLEKSQPGSPPIIKDTDDHSNDIPRARSNEKGRQRLVGSGNGRGQSCYCQQPESMGAHGNEPEAPSRNDPKRGNDREMEMETPPNTMGHISEMDSPQEVIVTDANNKTYKCIQVPICISTGKANTCRCCNCAPAPEPDEEEFVDEEAECTCNRQGKCTCVPGQMFNDEFGCECDLTNLERTLRDLIPNADCICYLKKKRRKRRKKWAPKVYYDRFANPPFVLNPKPRCLDYGIRTYCNPCCNPCCCAPVGKSCYTCDYGCGGCCRC
ncbi:uncharacterized protein CG42266 [Drosophila elegans]|uniref:uncharacterized protein CG42266 n=1 Tax=Drosophila elegans TaxID=30023 RepID=UPI0007E818AE|nr:uncharacterized protein CG42266 [Drosophila elegans]